ncbi:Nn.00g083690.m01.CDS01 [Neocucurbitaria sp. VM-36]
MSSSLSVFSTTTASQSSSFSPSASPIPAAPCSYIVQSGFESIDTSAWMAFGVGSTGWTFNVATSDGHSGSSAYLAAKKALSGTVEMNLDFPFTTSQSLSVEVVAYARSKNSRSSSCKVDVIIDDNKRGSTISVKDTDGWVKFSSGTVQLGSGAHAVRFHVSSSASTGQECGLDDVTVQLVGPGCAASSTAASSSRAVATTLLTVSSSTVVASQTPSPTSTRVIGPF